MSSSEPRDPHDPPVDAMDEILNADDIAEEIPEDDDVPMDSDDDPNQEEEFENNSIAYFDPAKDSLFCISQHPVHPSLIAVGGSAGKGQKDPGAGWVFDTSVIPPGPVLPASYASDPSAAAENPKLDSLFSIDGHEDTINALVWTLPKGEFLVSGGYDGRLRAWKPMVKPGSPFEMKLVGESHEASEINWIEPCPSPDHPNTIAVGTSFFNNPENPEENPKENKYLVYVYTIDPSNPFLPFEMHACYVLHDAACTAGAWTPDGSLLATVSKNSSLYVWDVWGEAAAQGLVKYPGQPVIALTKENQQFNVRGGLYSIAVDPNGAFVAVGGGGDRRPHPDPEDDEENTRELDEDELDQMVGEGLIRVIALPRLAAQSQTRSRGARGKASAKPTAGGGILASMSPGYGTVESLSVTVAPVAPPITLIAASSADEPRDSSGDSFGDSSITIYDASKEYKLRRTIKPAHGDSAVVKVEFIRNTWLLTSCGTDGVVRRWDLRSASPAESKEKWNGHRPDINNTGGGVMGFVQGKTGEQVVTVGDDGVSLVFEPKA